MNNIYDKEYFKNYGLEFYLLSCLIMWPELMPLIYIDDMYFKNHQKLWQFMKAFYFKYKTFNTALMRNVCADKYAISNYIEMIVDCGPIHKPTDFEIDIFQKQLVEDYNQSEKDKWLINKIYELANRLYVKELSIKEFEDKYQELKKVADATFRKEVKGE